MDIMNLQNFLVNQAPNQAFAEKNSAPVRQPQQKANSFASKLNTAVERSANGATGNEAAQPAAGVENPAALSNEDKAINENRPKQAAEDNPKDVSNANGSEQPLTGVKPEIPDEFLGAASLMAQMPPTANIIVENGAVQPDTPLEPQGNFFPDLSEKPGLSLTAEDLKILSADANATDKGQIISQTAANEPLVAAKQEPDVLPAKGELPKIAEASSDTILQQPNDDAKQPQARFPLANSAGELAKHGTELVKPTADADVAKPTADADVAKPAADADVAKPAVEITKLTVIDAAKPALETVKPNEQPVAGEATNLTLKEPAEQNFSNRQDTAGQQSFGQTMEFKPEQMKDSDQPQNNNHTFAISFDTATQNPVDKPGATQTQQTPEFATPRDEFQIKEQIIQQATLINRSAQESEMIIRLKPEHLGELALKVTVNNGVVNASFHSNNAEVRGILENSVQQLKNDLANAGFKVDNVSISAGLSQFAADQERAMQWQQQQTRRVSGKNGAGYAETVEGVAMSQQIVNASKDAGVDYRI